MQTEILFAIAAITASILLGTISNWIYDSLKERGVLPEQLTLKTITIVLFVAFPLILTIAFSEVSIQARVAILEALQTPLPIWQTIILTLCFCAVIFVMKEREANRLKNLIKRQQAQLDNMREQLTATEQRLRGLTRAGFPPEENIINPR